MVKVVDKGPEIKRKEELLSKLETLAVQALPRDGWKVRRDNDFNMLRIEYGIYNESVINVFSERRTVIVKKRVHFDAAYALAKLYEDNELGEFVVERYYKE